MKSFHISILKLHRWSLRHPVKILFVSTLLVLVSIFFSARLHYLISIDDLIDRDFKTYSQLESLRDDFHDQNTLMLSLESNQAMFSKSSLCDFQYWLLTVPERIPAIEKISSSFGVRFAEINDQNLSFESRLKLDCQRRHLPEEEKIKKAFEEIDRSPWNNILSIPARPALTVLFSIRPIEGGSTWGQFDTRIVDQIQNDFQNHLQQPQSEWTAHWAGIAAFQRQLRKAFDQSQALNALTFIIALFFFRFFLKSWKAGFLFLISILFSLTLVYGVMGLSSIPLDVLTNSVGLMLMISCLEDFVFVSYGVLFQKRTWRAALRKFIIPSFYTSLTTAIGFGSLVVSDLEIIRRFGAICAFAALMEWLAVFIFIPALVSKVPKLHLQSKFDQINCRSIMEKIPQFRISRTVAWAFVAVVFIGLFFVNTLFIEDSPEKLFHESHLVRQTSAHLLETRGWNSEVSLLLNGDDQNSAQIHKDAIKALSSNPLVGAIEDPFSAQNYLSKAVAPRYRTMIENLWKDSIFSRRLIAETGQKRAILYLRSSSLADISNLIHQVSVLCPQQSCELAGSLVSYNEFGSRILGTLFNSLFISLLIVMVVILLLSISLRSNHKVSALFSVIWGPLALLSFFVVSRFPIFYVTSICASVLVGLSGDNAIQFLFGKKRGSFEKSIDDLGTCSLIVTLGMILLSCVFFFSVFEPLQKLGGLIILGLIFVFVGDVWILRGLVRRKND
ncbi:MAG: hypothetical protein COT73_10155 [Bdellovibrio sp. CG10_big_fil_rev_8_21_14_0_10_47_8]|nr:MAG: hypothetical protein COT73_10155 [Bdellovibrio sp. CG10_big_fil_rev_8_21_14_0_10_47_8]